MSGHDLEKTFVERSPADLAMAAPIRIDGDGGAGGGPSAPPPAAPPSPPPPPPSTRPIVGQTRLGASLVLDIIGDGGMATVYKVWNEQLEVFRAAKLLSRPEHRSRFETEAKITAKLSHEGIVEIHSIGEWNGLPYMEMALVDGPTLQRILAERGKLPEIVCAAIALLVAEALAYAHSETYMLTGKHYCGIIHRDLKPANIMITASGAVKLIDFGIARPTQASLHTMEGNIAGTMYYLSPEQMDGGEVDNRSDIYSIGTILYEMVIGAKTFPQKSITELMKQKSVNKFKSPHEFLVNAGLANIIHRCLRRTPAKRYQQAQDLVADLQGFCGSITRQAPKTILKNYFSGAEEAIYADFDHARTQRRSSLGEWFLGKLNALGTTSKPQKEILPTKQALPEEIPSTTPNAPEAVEETPRAVEVPDNQQVPKPAEKTELVKAADSPKPAKPPKPPKEPKAVCTPSKPTTVVPPPEKPQKTQPLDKSKTAKSPKSSKTTKAPKAPKMTKPPKLPKKPKAPLGKPIAARLSETLTVVRKSVVSMYASAISTCKSTMSTTSARTAGIVLLVLFAVFLLSYFTIRTISAQRSSKNSLMAKASTGVDTMKEFDSTALASTPPTESDSVAMAADALSDSVAPTPPPAPAAAVSNIETENGYLRIAAAASMAGQWGKVIEMLEPDSIYKHKNDQRILYLLNAYVESRQFGKAQAIIDNMPPHSPDAYLLLCKGKLQLYQGSPVQALDYFKSVLSYPSSVETESALNGAALYFIADIMQERFKVTPTALNRSSALEAWRKVSKAFASEDPQAERAEREISALNTEQPR